MAGVTSVVIDGTSYLVDDINAVDFSEDQGLSEQQQEQGRSNIGAVAEAALAGKADKADLDTLEGTVDELSDDVDGLTEALADKADVIVDTASGAIASFPDGAAVPAKDITIGIEPVQSGSGDPSPENVRPISGWTGANVTRTGKNLLNPSSFVQRSGYNNLSVSVDGNKLEVIGYSSGGRFACFNVHTEIGKQYSINCGSLVGAESLSINEKDEEPTSWVGYGGSSTIPMPYTYTATKEWVQIFFELTANATIENLQIELGSTATTYEPYTGTTLPISWQSEAGTVYGGTLDVTTGLLTVDSFKKVLNGTEPYTSWSGEKGFISGNSSMLPSAENLNCCCTHYNRSNSPFFANLEDFSWLGSGAVLYFHDSRISSVEEFQAFLADQNAKGTPVTIVAKLTTPLSPIQLDPVTVTTLLGQNNVWADTGDSTVTYRADTKLYIQKINAPTDDDMIADAQIANGRYFIIGGNLYRSTTTIPVGDTITPGTNCILTNLADALNALNT